MSQHRLLEGRRGLADPPLWPQPGTGPGREQILCEKNHGIPPDQPTPLDGSAPKLMSYLFIIYIFIFRDWHIGPVTEPMTLTRFHSV